MLKWLSGILTTVLSGWILHDRLLHRLRSWSWYFLNSDIKQGSVVTQLRCDEIISQGFVANLLVNLSVKEIWKSVNSWRSYDSQCRFYPSKHRPSCWAYGHPKHHSVYRPVYSMSSWVCLFCLSADSWMHAKQAAVSRTHGRCSDVGSTPSLWRTGVDITGDTAFGCSRRIVLHDRGDVSDWRELNPREPKSRFV